MDTYSVYLVDDEPWALVYLEKIVKWEEMGFRIGTTDAYPYSPADTANI